MLTPFVNRSWILKMIEVKVEFKGFLVHLSGCTEMCLTAEPGIQLAKFLILLTERLGGDFKKLVLDQSGTVDGGIMIAIEGKAVPYSQVTSYRLDKNCSLSIVPLVAGG
jgi:sulfur carrier protein ThiS